MEKIDSKIESPKMVSSRSVSLDPSFTKHGNSNASCNKRTRPWLTLFHKKDWCCRRHRGHRTLLKQDPIKDKPNSIPMRSNHSSEHTPLIFPNDSNGDCRSTHEKISSYTHSVISYEKDLGETLLPKEISFDEKWYTWSQTVFGKIGDSLSDDANTCHFTDDESSPVEGCSIAVGEMQPIELADSHRTVQTGMHARKVGLGPQYEKFHFANTEPISDTHTDIYHDNAFSKSTTLPSLQSVINDLSEECSSIEMPRVDHEVVATWDHFAQRRKYRLLRLEHKRIRRKKIIRTSCLSITTLCLLTLLMITLENAYYYFKTRNNIEKEKTVCRSNEGFRIHQPILNGDNYFDECLDIKVNIS